ncbi:MAG: 50S ribosomal protein L10 [Phycisphaerales bacterium]|nr:50S ribosomal protein L10 [Phycisphaerales bacterium]
MSKMVKETITKELAQRYAAANDAVWVELIGVDGITTNNFRRTLRDRHMRLEVVKTSLLRRAVSGGPLSRLAEKLEGPAALVTGGGSAVEVAKVLEEWSPKFPKDSFRVRGALLEGELIGEEQVKDLSKMPTRRDLQGRVAGMLLSPGGKLVGALLSPGGNIAGCLKTIIEKLEKGEPIAKAG